MTIKNLGKNFFINSSLILIIFLLDRISKIYVINLSKNSFDVELFSSKFLNINLIWNKGIAFGLFSSSHEIWYNFLTIIIFFIALIILIMSIKQHGVQRYFLLIVFGGALGNLYDRIFFKAVPDFIDFHVGNFHWFIFNVSDIFITIGIIFMVISEIIQKPRNDYE